MTTDRFQPHDISAEEAVIGSILVDEDSIARISGNLRPEHFYARRNQACYEACLSLHSKTQPIDTVSLAHELSGGEGILELVGGAEYLSLLVSNVPTSVHIEYYASVVRDTSDLRKLVSAGERVVDLAFDGMGVPIDDVLDRAEQTLYSVRSTRSQRDFKPLRGYLDDYMEHTGALNDPASLSTIGPISTGYSDLDEILGGGLHRSDLIILAARPSLGKSTLALNIARQAAGEGISAGVFSLEMSGEQIASRLVSSEADIDNHRLRMNLIRESEEVRILDAVGLLSDLRLFIDESPFQTVADMRSKSKRLQQEHGLDILVVDYLQLVETPRGDNRAVGLGEVSRALKGIARELDIPVIACSQLSRAIEQRPNHRPMLSDLRESGNIEQDSDIVAFIHREDRFLTREEWDRKNPNRPYPENIAEIIVSKHRNGPVGTAALYFRNSRLRFETLRMNSPIPDSPEYVPW